MKKILTTIVGAVFLSGCSTLPQKQDSPVNQEQNKQTADDSFVQRMKLAQSPYSFLAVDYMDVADGKEQLYLEVETLRMNRSRASIKAQAKVGKRIVSEAVLSFAMVSST